MLSGNLSSRGPGPAAAQRAASALTGTGLLLMRGLTGTSHWTALLAGFVAGGAGVGLVNPALASTAIGVVPPQQSGMAAGINTTFRQVGIATGIAVLGALFESAITNNLAPRLRRHAGGRPGGDDRSRRGRRRRASRSSAPIPASLRAHRRHRDPRGLRHGAMNEILLVAGIVALVPVRVLSLVLVRGARLRHLGLPQRARPRARGRRRVASGPRCAGAARKGSLCGTN